jgi:hypothetical protein
MVREATAPPEGVPFDDIRVADRESEIRRFPMQRLEQRTAVSAKNVAI